MIEVGRVCVKIAGRDSNRKCVIVDVIDENFVVVDGDVRRRKCNVRHIEPLEQVIKLTKAASHEEVAKEFKKLGLGVWDKKPKTKATEPVKKKEIVKEKKTKN